MADAAAHFDQTTTDAIAKRLRSLDDNTPPLWGSMTVPQMRAHMKTAVRYSLGKEPLVPPEGSAFVRLIFPLFLNGWLKLPRNAEKPKLYQGAPPTATLDEVMEEVKEFRAGAEAGTLDPPPHSALGDLGLVGWAKLHRIHFDHHLRQFGV